MSSTRNMLPLTEAFYYILVALYADPSHGYRIMQDVEKMSNGRVSIGAGTLYTALSTLTKKGLIENAEDDSETRRKMYTITADGRDVLMAEMERLDELLKNGKRVMNGEGSLPS